MSGATSWLDAVVIRSIDYGEGDRVIGLLTREEGKLSTFAASARKSQRRFGGAFDLFARVRAELRPPRAGRQGLWSLQRIEMIEPHVALRERLERLALASYWAECLWLMAGEGDSQPRLFDWWCGVLEELCRAENASTLAPRFDLELLSLCGYGPRLEGCLECGQRKSGGQLFFGFERGGLLCRSCRPMGEGRWLDADALVSLSGSSVQQAIDAFVTYTLGREPKSQKFREEVLRGSG